MQEATPPAAGRLRLAIVSNALHPYREHLHRRIVDELPVELVNYVTHARGDFAWSERAPHPHVSRTWLTDDATAKTSAARRRPATEYRKAARLITDLEANPPHAVIVEGYGDAGRLRLIRHLARGDIPFFLRADSNIRGDTPSPPVSWVKGAVIRWIVRHADGLMPVGKLGVQYFARYGASREMCYIVPYEPDYGYWAEAPERETTSPAGGPPTLAFVGRLVAAKGVDLLLEALSQPAVAALSWRLVVAGDGPELPRLKAMAGERLAGRVLFRGFCDEATVREIYHEADTLVVPSSTEPWGNVVAEAMAAGTRILATDAVGAAYDLVDRAEVGTIFPTGDVTALANGIAAHLKTPLTPAGRDVVRARLAEWRAANDPVDGVKRALARHGLLPQPPSS